MKIVIDIAPLRTGHKARGIGTYTRELCRALRQIDKTNSYILTTKPQEITGVSLVHYPYFDLFWHTLPVKKTTKTVVTIHDVIPLVFPRWFRPGLRGRWRFWWQRLALKKADAVITDSQHSKSDIGKYLKVALEKIHVIPLAAAAEFNQRLSDRQLNKIKNKYHLPDKYLLYVGDINPHKNLARLMEAFKQVRATRRDLHLVLVSRALAQPIPEAKQLKDLINDLQISKAVKILTGVPMDPIRDLVGIYNLAWAYVHPSLYEGFGLPVLEALTAGLPVVCSAAASLPEVYGQAAISFDAQNIKSMTSAINQALQLSKVEKAKLIKAAKIQASHFSWQLTAQQTLAVYKQVIYG
jgi:glycosyltransferase involved in cell wall biosynthesis